jgi:hypothetical protein
MTIERGPQPAPERDPYAPPPRYKNKSGGMLRVVILAALLGVAFAGYSFYASQPQSAGLVAEEQELAANDAPSAIEPMTDSAPPADASTESAPASAPAPAAAPRSAPPTPAPVQQAPASEPLPPPSTTTIAPSSTPPVN